jgi:hypothetical protein
MLMLYALLVPTTKMTQEIILNCRIALEGAEILRRQRCGRVPQSLKFTAKRGASAVLESNIVQVCRSAADVPSRHRRGSVDARGRERSYCRMRTISYYRRKPTYETKDTSTQTVLHMEGHFHSREGHLKASNLQSNASNIRSNDQCGEWRDGNHLLHHLSC